MSSFKIGVISDTHKRGDLQKEAISQLKSKGAEYLLHLGDFELVENLENLATSGLPYAGVFGNNDYALKGLEYKYKIESEPYFLKIKDTTIKMMHLPYYLTNDSDIVLFGHLHKFSAEYKGGSLFLNPGEICAREKDLSECAIIEVSKSHFLVDYIYREPTALKWSSREFEFKRD